jgi:hypothetical protein
MKAVYSSLKKAVFAARPGTIEMPTTRNIEEEVSMTTEMPTIRNMEEEAWYRNPWVWLIIAIPSLTVAGCLFTIYLALSNPDHLVTDTPTEGDAPAAQSR